jgi:hypothetical protein
MGLDGVSLVQHSLHYTSNPLMAIERVFAFALWIHQSLV